MLQILKTSSTIVVFDGVCTICNRTVDFLIQHDRDRALMFGSFQSDHVAELLREHGVTEAPTTVYVITPAQELLTESDAILYLGTHLGGRWHTLSRAASIVPRPLRNIVYRWIAKNRYQWFGRRDTCRVPTVEEQSRFL